MARSCRRKIAMGWKSALVVERGVDCEEVQRGPAPLVVEECRWPKLSRTARNGTAVREVQAEWSFFESHVDCVMKRVSSFVVFRFPPQSTTQAEPAAEPLFGAIRWRAINGSIAAIVGKGARGIGGIVARVRGGAGWSVRWSSVLVRSKKSREHLCGESVASLPVTCPRAWS